MMFDNLNATQFEYGSIFYNSEFEDILSKIITCYELMLADKVTLTNAENAIRDVLLINYLKNNSIRKQINLTNYLFDREVPEDRSLGRTDIKIQTKDTFEDTNAYYTIECKRLDATNITGTTGLNVKYIDNGIARFVSSYYQTYHKTNGLIGFVVEPIDINKNVVEINNLLAANTINTNTIQDLQYKRILAGFNYSYCSYHNITGNKVLLYHLMFDFSKNIQ